MAHQNRVMKAPGPLPTLPQQRQVRPQVAQPVAPRRPKFVGRLATGVMSVMLKSTCGAPTSDHKMTAFPTLYHGPQHIIRAQSAHARKSPGNSVESMSPKMHPTQQIIRAQSAHARKSPGTSIESISPKMTHPNTPSPHVQHQFGMSSPSPLAAPTSGKSTPSQSRPLSRNFPPANPVIRRSSVDQFGNAAQLQQNRPLNINAVPSPPVSVNVAGVPAIPQNYLVRQASSTSKNQDNVQVSTELPSSVRHQQWPNPAIGSNPTQYLWKGQATVPTTPSLSTTSGQSYALSAAHAPVAEATSQFQPVLEKPISNPATPINASNPTPGTGNSITSDTDTSNLATSTTTNDISEGIKDQTIVASAPEPQSAKPTAQSAASDQAV